MTDTTKRQHVTLCPLDKACLEFMRTQHGVTASAAIRIAVRAAAKNLGFDLKKYSEQQPQ